ncbi:cyclodeaminase [Serratia sp. Tan611]|uniref:cyclodeaminase n=1 Tax=Serratia sp. Tan611 TaxID=2773264 RepID=UPI0019340529|nr:cyclodeaminase [Serratia sp. Tan611]CAE1146132.1 Ornithine cyclodeaminase [Serratia sp. Tan611]
MQIYNRQQISAVVRLDAAALAAVEAGFRALGTGNVVQPPILSMALPEVNGEVDVKTAWIRGSDSFAIKISPGFFDNPRRGLPSLNGLMVVLSAETGVPRALLLDEGYLTAVRTALAGLLAAKYLARPESRRITLIGAGEQARLQLAALRLLFPVEQVSIWARRTEAAQRLARELSDAGLQATGYPESGAACAGADIIVTTTPSREPLLFAEHLPPGVHVTAMGSDSPDKREIDISALLHADHVVCDLRSQSEHNGELKAFNGQTPPFTVYELGALVAGGTPLRLTPQDITLCCLSGTGVQDSAIAAFALAQLEQLEQSQ